uniref:Uncharacterized protein n=1 Tax=Physcomitrium patens TaxID=3218 RepID=A0A2K1JMZ9_PHYPA|nr:hypothetical protein PHYPA_017742 [Physcomitrium patens]
MVLFVSSGLSVQRATLVRMTHEWVAECRFLHAVFRSDHPGMFQFSPYLVAVGCGSRGDRVANQGLRCTDGSVEFYPACLAVHLPLLDRSLGTGVLAKE